MKTELSLNKIKSKLQELVPKAKPHASFAVIIIILLVYIFTVWHVGHLATAEPSATDQNSADTTSVPKVDQNAINQVLQLENNSPQVHSLFNAARNNPFGE